LARAGDLAGLDLGVLVRLGAGDLERDGVLRAEGMALVYEREVFFAEAQKYVGDVGPCISTGTSRQIQYSA